MLSFQLPVRAGQSVTLTWNPSIATNIAGYKIYAGTTSRQYSITNVVGEATNATLSGLVEGQMYYFAATTYDNISNESDFSSEATWTGPVAAASLTSMVNSGGQFSFTVSGLASAQYVVEASTNLSNWVAVQTNIAPFTFVDPNVTRIPQCFYRAYYLSP